MKFNPEIFNKGLVASIYGICGVFLVLILFYLLTRIMMYIAHKLPTKKDE